MKKEGVVFDLWNTLVVKRGKGLTQIVSDYYDLPYDAVYEWIRLSSLAKNKTDKYYYLKMICQANGLTFRKDDCTFFDAVEDNYHKECVWLNGAVETLTDLRKDGYKIGILSNSSEISYNVINEFGLRGLVDDIVLSCEVGFLKPDPRIFQRILSNLDLMPEQIVMVGDKITTDVLGAKIMGIDVIFFNAKESDAILDPNISFLAITNEINGVTSIMRRIKKEYENNQVFSIDIPGRESVGAEAAY